MSNSEWQVEFDRASSESWSQMIEQFDDANIYQTSAYGEVRWGERNLSRLVLRRNDEVVGAAQFRIIRPTPLKFGIAYLRWGPLWERRSLPLDLEVPVRMARAIEDEYLKARKLCVRILPNAFAGSARAAIFQSAFMKFGCDTKESAEIYRTSLMDLSLPLEQLRSRLDKKWRNQLSKSEKFGLTLIAGQGSAEYSIFREIYVEMLKRKAFETTVDIEEFGRIHETLQGAQRMQVLICLDKGVPVAGLVVSAMGNSAIYLLGATSDAGLHSKGAYLLQWTLIGWLKERGIRWYDLGGIDPEGNPGVYHFKKGFSGEDICQISPFIASESVISMGIARAGLAMRHKARASLRQLFARRSRRKALATY